jgi:phytanoyl-CoA hydroxylase
MATVLPAKDPEVIKRTLYKTDEAAKGRILPAYVERLSEADRAFYREQGYLAIDGLYTAEEVESYKAALADVINGRVGKDKKLYIQEEPYYKEGGSDERVVDDVELRVRKVFYFVQIEPRLALAGSHPRLLNLLDQLIEPAHRMIQDMALLKPPFHGSEKPWHQDTAYFDWTPLGGIIGVWIALDEATVDNGCMQVIPGTQLLGPTPHYHLRDCQIVDERVNVDRAVVVPLKPGGALFFSGLIHHGTPPNVSGDRRRALQFHYAAADCRNMTFKEHAELFNEGGAYAGCRKWDPEVGIPKAVYTP